MLQKIPFPKSGEYRSGTDHEPFDFYHEALQQSIHLDLLLGYFSSSAIHVLSFGFAKFISNGGTLRLVINQFLSPRDKAAILEGEQANQENYPFSITDFGALKDALDEYGKHFFECLAWLISSKRVEIRVTKPKGKSGISHYKSGVFSDGIHKVKFKGSCNFTAYGLLENLEELDVKLSWEVHNEVFEEYEVIFEELFTGTSEYAELVPVNQVEEIILNNFGGKGLNELLIDEETLLKLKSKKQTYNYPIVDNILEEHEKYQKSPKFPFKEGPRNYQIEAYDNWLSNGCKGIFAMATGTGKTITALNCVLNDYKDTSSYQVVILVPTTVLLDQWTHECQKFNFREIVAVSSKSPHWQRELGDITNKLSFGVSKSFVVIVTYKSFTNSLFQTYFKRLPKTTILLADEAHNIASPSVAKLLNSVHLDKRIGLSATPKRIYDPVGSDQMEEFFADKEPYTYNFSMERAITEGILCSYYYFPRIVRLTPEEMESYTEISTKLAKIYARNQGEGKISQQLEMLLMERKRIIHKAKGKLKVFEDILRDILTRKGGIDYTLIYAPEGSYADSELDGEAFPNLTAEENRIIDFYASIVRRVSPSTTITQYTSASDNKDEVLKQFEQGQINTLLSMKCLDEGVDIPRTEQAIFCSSTGNPRQFIQRRGRILRQHTDKNFAYIYDMIVIPTIHSQSPNFQLEQSLVRKELERVVHFAYMAINKYEAINTFSDVCNIYQLNLDTIHNDLIA